MAIEIQAEFHALDRVLAARFPTMFAQLRPGVSDSELDAFEVEFGTPIPAEFRALYSWHDGAAPSFGGPALPGISSWNPLMRVISVCAAWQDSWVGGFDPWWIPITWEGDHAFAISATGDVDGPARAIEFWPSDGVIASCDSVTDMVSQVRLLVESGAFGLDAHGRLTIIGDVDPSLTLFTRTEGDIPGEPDQPLHYRFLPRPRSEVDLVPHSDLAVRNTRFVELLHDLAAVANGTLERDLEVVGLGRFERLEPDAVPAALSGYWWPLDVLYRAFVRNGVAEHRWRPQWREAEGIIFGPLDL